MSTGENIKALKSGIWYTMSNFLVKALGIITTPIFTRLLTKEEFGEYSNFTSWVSIIVIIVTLNTEASLISAKFDYKDRFDNYIFSVMSFGLTSTLLWTLVFTLLSNVATRLFDMNMTYVYCMMLYILFNQIVGFFQTREKYQYQYKKSVLTSIVLAVSTSLLSVLLVVFMGDRLTARILGSIIPTVVVGIIFAVFFIVKGKKIDFKCWKYALPICLPYIPHLLSLTVLNSVDRIMIIKICGEVDAAMYSLAYTCGSLITMLITSMNSAFAPWLGDRLHAKEYGVIRKFSYKYILAFSYMAIMVMLVAPELLWILGGDGYQTAKYVMPPVAMGCVAQFIYTMFVNVEQFSRKTIGMAFASVSAAALNYGLNLIFIPRFGYVAAAYTTLAGFLWLLAVHMFLVYRLKLTAVYNYPFIILLVGVMCVMTILVGFLYNAWILRYLLLLAFVAIGIGVVYKYRNVLLGFLKGKAR